MIKIIDIYNESIKKILSTDNFTNIMGENSNSDVNYKIIVEDNFSDSGIEALYKLGAEKYNIEFNIINNSSTEAELYGESANLIKFLIDICEMPYEHIQKKYSKLNFEEYNKLNND